MSVWIFGIDRLDIHTTPTSKIRDSNLVEPCQTHDFSAAWPLSFHVLCHPVAILVTRKYPGMLCSFAIFRHHDWQAGLKVRKSTTLIIIILHVIGLLALNGLFDPACNGHLLLTTLDSFTTLDVLSWVADYLRVWSQGLSAGKSSSSTCPLLKCFLTALSGIVYCSSDWVVCYHLSTSYPWTRQGTWRYMAALPSMWSRRAATAPITFMAPGGICL